jgi:hypothetical protein
VKTPLSPAVRRGAASGLITLALLVLALLPSRLAVAMRVRGGTGFERVTRALAGTALDLSAVVLPVLLLVLSGALLFSLHRRARGWWQHLAAPLVAVPSCVVLYLLTVTEQEVKAERGAFSTMQEIALGAAEQSFVEGALGFFRYERVWMPAVVCSALAVVLLVTWVRAARAASEVPHRPWLAGLGGVLALAAVLVPGLVAAQSFVSARLSPAALGDPLHSLIETTADLLNHRVPARPSELLLQLDPTPDEVATGAQRLGWPAPNSDCAAPHPHARPLDRDAEPATPGAPLLAALSRVSALLFDPAEPPIALFQFSLESFRGDDLHALHPAAPRELAPFINGLYESRVGVLASRRTFQAGVRTAQGLAAMTCGVGTLPYNLSIIRDLDAFPLRCAPDLLSEAGFRGTFFYGSDATYDEMSRFLTGHGIAQVISQDELPPTLPRGAWSGVTDFALFDAAATHVAAGLAQGPQYALVMSLSNHSPYTPPEDLPEHVRQRVTRAADGTVNRASQDERRRLLTYSYTDAALERFFAQLDALHLADRSIVVVLADHSTGEDYVWGPDSIDHETDAAKAQVPFAIVVPEPFLARVKDRPALERALADAQALLDATTLSQNDVPALLLALLEFHPGLRALEQSRRWHTLGGQVTSPWFRPGGDPRSHLVGINGVDELYVLDRESQRVGAYEDAVFLRTRGDRSRVTPRLIPVAATLVQTLRVRTACYARGPGGDAGVPY